MLSIPGQDYADVFRNLAAHPDLDDRERAAAAIIAEDMAARDRWDAERAATADRFWREDWATADAMMDDWESQNRRPESSRYHVHAPMPECRNFDVNGTGIRFHVRPYTAGQTMNVGIGAIP